jgi:tetratricopeptide (TPR) repeat protein
MENTRLIELRRAYATELAAGRYSTAEQICWDALEICGYRGPCGKLSYWLNSARLKESQPEEVVWLWRWARFLADIYYELGKYTEAEPLYARLAVLWMSLSSELKGRAETRALLPDLLRKLAAAEAFIGKERRAGKHWTLAKALSGKQISPQTVDAAAFASGSPASSRTDVKRTLSREGHIKSSFRRGESFPRRNRFRRS